MQPCTVPVSCSISTPREESLTTIILFSESVRTIYHGVSLPAVMEEENIPSGVLVLVFLSVSTSPALLFSWSPPSWSGEMMGLQEMSGVAAMATEEEGRLSRKQEVSSLARSRVEDTETARDYRLD